MGEAPVLGLPQRQTWAYLAGVRTQPRLGECVGGDTGPQPAAFWPRLLLTGIFLVWTHPRALARPLAPTMLRAWESLAADGEAGGLPEAPRHTGPEA